MVGQCSYPIYNKSLATPPLCCLPPPPLLLFFLSCCRESVISNTTRWTPYRRRLWTAWRAFELCKYRRRGKSSAQGAFFFLSSPPPSPLCSWAPFFVFPHARKCAPLSMNWVKLPLKKFNIELLVRCFDWTRKSIRPW